MPSDAVLARADWSRLEQLVSRRVGPEGFGHVLRRAPGDIEVVIEFSAPEAII